MKQLNICIFGLSITSAWGNGHATTYRSLIKSLHRRGHRTTFYERDVPWYADHRDLPHPEFCSVELYRSLDDIRPHLARLRSADLIIVGSYVQEARQLTQLLQTVQPRCLSFYDIDTPVTVAKLDAGDYEYLHPKMIPSFDLYLSFSGGPFLDKLTQKYGANRVRPLYCSVDEDLYFPQEAAAKGAPRYQMGYLGTFSPDRQPTVEKFLVKPAQERPSDRFCIAGAQYPASMRFPENVETVEHIPPREHRDFYNAQKFTLNVTRRDMIAAGYSPSVRLFEAGACATPVISDDWPGLDSFFEPGDEILIARSTRDVLEYFQMDESRLLDIGRRFRARVLGAHTSAHRALQLEQYVAETVTSARRAQPTTLASFRI